MTTFSQRETALLALQQRVVQARQLLNQAKAQIDNAAAAGDATKLAADMLAALSDLAADTGTGELTQNQQLRRTTLLGESATLATTAAVAGALWTTCKSVLDAADLSAGLSNETKQSLLAAVTQSLG